MRLLYLDLDGVLHPADVWRERGHDPSLGDQSRGHVLFEHAGLLEQLLALHDDVKLVLSTSWVPELGLDYVLGRLPVGLSHRVIGATFDPAVHGAGFGAIARGYQVQADLRRRKVRDWRALDDDAADWPEEDLGNLIATDAVAGLSAPASLAKLTNWLEGREND